MRDAPAELSPEQFRSIGHQLVDEIANFLATIRERPVTPKKSAQELRALLGARAAVPVHGTDPALVASEAAALLIEHSTLNGHPRFFGYITSSASPIGALADMLAASVNPNLGGSNLSPIATEIERQAVRWVAELIGYPVDAGGLLVSGGNMANMVCLIAALRAKAGWDVRTNGLAAQPRLAVYASAEVHTWLQKATDICGLGIDAIRSVSVDASFAMDMKALKQQVADDRAAGWRPAVVVGTAGSVSTGAVDPLPQIRDFCKEQGLWFHVDGAYGAPAVLLDDAPATLRALSDADSVAVDPHKWLYAPMEAGCALVREPEQLRTAFSFHPPYYHFPDEPEPPINYYEWGPQNSRGFRALKVWMTIRQVGREGYVKMLNDDVALSCELFRLVSARKEFEAFTQSLSISTFRYVPADLRPNIGAEATEEYLNKLNTAVLTRLQQEGKVYLSNAVLDGRFVLRACTVNFRTTSADIAALVDAVVEAGLAADQEMRTSQLVEGSGSR